MKRSGIKRSDKGLKRDPSKALKRSPLSPGDKPLQRGDRPLRADPGKTREFKQRAVENSNRRDPLPDDIRERVLARCDHSCVMCGGTTWLDPHHILAVQRWPEIELEEFNIIILCRGCHDAHERHAVKVPRSKLPIQFNRFLYGHPDREVYVEKHYADA